MSWFKKDPLQIISFLSYGTKSHFYTRGRALEDETIDLERKSLWGLFVNTFKRFESDEIKHTPIQVKLPNGKIFETKSDEDGYFKVDVTTEDLHELADNKGWLQFEMAYTDGTLNREIREGNRFLGELIIPNNNVEFGVISDIDDTIVHTGVVSRLKWRVIYNTVFKNAKNRVPLEGAADFYQKLHKGKSGNNANPIFYVSHSPWNLYRYLDYFLKQNNFPKGPILLRSFRTILKKKTKDFKPQKQIEIEHILNTYQDLEFILIGDCGEHDPDIYLHLAKAFPNKIKAIYLRSVDHAKKMERIKELVNNQNHTPTLIVEDSKLAITHAEKLNFIK